MKFYTFEVNTKDIRSEFWSQLYIAFSSDLAVGSKDHQDLIANLKSSLIMRII